MTSELVDASKVLYAEQKVMINLPENTFPVKGEIFSLNDVNLMIDVDRSTVPVGFVPPERGAEVTISFTGTDCMYRVSVHLKDNLSDKDRLWRFERPVRVIRLQKRKYFRVPACLPIRLSMTSGVGRMDSSVYSRTVDISAGGICFYAPSPLSIGQTMLVIIEELPGLDSFPVLGDVVRCTKEENPEEEGTERWLVGLNMEPHLQGGMQERLSNAVALMQQDYIKSKLR